ncbi:DUF2799 domain-containing protein [Bdellovibrio sp. HCB209]|uniref:DUF2799 domain-containing protein n=1 Tax=Bdellovibrio sp. HCB209 TaxID=3394354 RepID=UPI0039B55FFC
MKKLILAALISSTFVGCASALKKDCEATNWFKYGEEVAMRGEWLNSDPKLLSCRKEEAEISETQADLGFKSGRQKYCTGSNSYLVGKSGDAFAKDMCDTPALKSIVSDYNKGLRDYCAKANGFNAGVSGKKYKNLCPADMESSFLPEYRRGRLKYVEAQIKNLENRQRDLDLAISNKNTQIVTANMTLMTKQNRKNMVESQRNYAQSVNNANEVNRLETDLRNADWEVNRAQQDVDRTNREKRNLENEKDQASKNIADYRTEMAGLQN